MGAINGKQINIDGTHLDAMKNQMWACYKTREDMHSPTPVAKTVRFDPIETNGEVKTKDVKVVADS